MKHAAGLLSRHVLFVLEKACLLLGVVLHSSPLRPLQANQQTCWHRRSLTGGNRVQRKHDTKHCLTAGDGGFEFGKSKTPALGSRKHILLLTWALASSAQSELTTLTFWFPHFGFLFVVIDPKDDHLFVPGPLGK